MSVKITPLIVLNPYTNPVCLPRSEGSAANKLASIGEINPKQKTGTEIKSIPMSREALLIDIL